MCKDDKVDEAVVEITNDVTNELKQPLESRAQLLSFSGPSSENFPGKSPIEVQPGDDVIVIGYPSEIYDEFNKLPILKTGMLNTPLGLHFEGLSAFLIDFKYYEGSSGSVIITKPTHFGFDKDNKLQLSETRQYVFLGVYQGAWYRTIKNRWTQTWGWDGITTTSKKLSKTHPSSTRLHKLQ